MAKDNSSLPLLLTITGAVVSVAVGGWFFLEQESSEPASAPPPSASVLEQSPRAESPPAGDTSNEPAAPTTAAETGSSLSASEVNLRKAQLAAESGILVFPEASSALHYYGLVLAEAPDNAIARAERDTVLAEIARVVAAHLDAEEFSDAYSIASLVSRQVPDHLLVIETQQVLDARSNSLVDEAIQLARNGDDRRADELLAAAEALPGRNPDYFVAVRESVTEIRDVRNAAAKERRRRAQLAEDQARDAWVQQVRSAIAEGNLIFPAGASAAEMLAESNAWSAERETLAAEFRVALINAVDTTIGNGGLDDAEVMLDYLYTMDDGTDDLDPLRAALENAFVDNQSQSFVRVADLTRVSAAPPKYPRLALEREISGWVEVYFTVTPQGSTADISVNDSNPSRVFDKAAVKAVEKWQFEPVQYRGQVISQRVATRLAFKLD